MLSTTPIVEIPLIRLFKSKNIKLKTRCLYLVHMAIIVMPEGSTDYIHTIIKRTVQRNLSSIDITHKFHIIAPHYWCNLKLLRHQLKYCRRWQLPLAPVHSYGIHVGIPFTYTLHACCYEGLMHWRASTWPHLAIICILLDARRISVPKNQDRFDFDVFVCLSAQ